MPCLSHNRLPKKHRITELHFLFEEEKKESAKKNLVMFCFHKIITSSDLSVCGPCDGKEALKRNAFYLCSVDFTLPKQKHRHWSLRCKRTTCFQYLWNQAGIFLDIKSLLPMHQWLEMTTPQSTLCLSWWSSSGVMQSEIPGQTSGMTTGTKSHHNSVLRACTVAV